VGNKKPEWKIVKAGEAPPSIITEAFIPMIQCIEKMAKIDKKNFDKKFKERK